MWLAKEDNMLNCNNGRFSISPDMDSKDSRDPQIALQAYLDCYSASMD